MFATLRMESSWPVHCQLHISWCLGVGERNTDCLRPQRGMETHFVHSCNKNAFSLSNLLRVSVRALIVFSARLPADASYGHKDVGAINLELIRCKYSDTIEP